MRSVFIVVNYAHGHGMIPTNSNDLTGLYILAKPQYHHRRENVMLVGSSFHQDESFASRAETECIEWNIKAVILSWTPPDHHIQGDFIYYLISG